MDSIVNEKIRETYKIQKSDDLLKYYNLAGSLLDYVLDKEFPLSMGIYGKWGSGKTVLANFMKNIVEKEKRKGYEKVEFIEFDVAKHRESKEKIIWHLMVKILGNEEVEKVLSSPIRFFHKILGMFTKKYIHEDATDVLELFFTDEGLKKELEEKIEEKTKGKKCIVIIDNLDRLLPIDSILFLEQLKSFLLVDRTASFNNFAYLVLCDFNVISKEIQNIYKEKINVREYLNKLIEIPFYLPKYKPVFTENLVMNLLANEVPGFVKAEIKNVFDLAKISTPRDVKNFLVELDMLFIIGKSRGIAEEDLIKNLGKITAMQVIKIRYSEVYDFIESKKEELKNKKNLMESGFVFMRLYIDFNHSDRINLNDFKDNNKDEYKNLETVFKILKELNIFQVKETNISGRNDLVLSSQIDTLFNMVNSVDYDFSQVEKSEDV